MGLRSSTRGAFPPRNESELVHRRPPSHQDGVFPRRLLLPGERIIFEGRPSLWAQRRGTISALLVLFFLAVLVLVVALAALPGAPDATSAGWVTLTGVLLWSALLALVVLDWRRSAFALTQRRVLMVRGFSGSRFRFAEWAQVERMVPPPGAIAPIRFEVRAPLGAPDSGRYARETIVWEAVRWAPWTYEFVQTAFSLASAQTRREARELEVRDKILEGRVLCEYCGNLIAVPEGEAPPPSCPRCTAPLPATPTTPPARALPVVVEDPLGQVRPAVYLGLDAVAWFRAFAVAWMLAILAVGAVAQFSLSPASGDAARTGVVAAVVGLVILFPLSYFLWLQSIRKWWTAIRTLRRGLAAGSEWHTRVARPLYRWTTLILGGFAGSLLVPLAILLLEVGLGGPPVANAQPSLQGRLATDAAVAGFGLLAALGQLALVWSFSKLVEHSEVPSIETRLLRARRLSLASIAVGLWPVAIFLFLANTSSSAAPPGYVLWGGLLGPIGLFIGLTETARAYGEWTRIADRVAEAPYLGEEQDSRRATSYTAIGLAAAMPGESFPGGGFRFLPGGFDRARWMTLALAVIAAPVLVVVVIFGTGWVAQAVGTLGGSAGPPPRPPIVIANATDVWAIPVNHYEFQSFRLNHSASLTGDFTSTGTVVGYVMDSLDYTRWMVVGRVVSDQYSTGNVTMGGFHLRLPFNDRWYVIVENLTPSSTVDVTWTSQCAVVFAA